MIFRQLLDPTSYTFTYLLGDPKTQSAILIDPVKEHVDSYLKLIAELGLTLNTVIDTHVHADHITGSGLLRQKTQCEILMGQGAQVNGLTQTVQDQERFTIGDFAFTALHTPGHTDDSYSYLLNDRVFTGDCLLIRGSGRTDFQNGDPIAAYDAITQKLFTLPDETWVYPAHDYKTWTVSTIGEEKQFNPRLQVESAEEYKQIMDNLNLPKPKLIEQAVPANRECGL
jgi:sulfur dioxygenase